MTKVKRAHSLALAIGADTKDDLVAELHHIAERVARDDLTIGGMGGPSCGYTYAYHHDPDMTHDRYFELIDIELAEARSAASPERTE